MDKEILKEFEHARELEKQKMRSEVSENINSKLVALHGIINDQNIEIGTLRQQLSKKEMEYEKLSNQIENIGTKVEEVSDFHNRFFVTPSPEYEAIFNQARKSYNLSKQDLRKISGMNQDRIMGWLNDNIDPLFDARMKVHLTHFKNFWETDFHNKFIRHIQEQAKELLDSDSDNLKALGNELNQVDNHIKSMAGLHYDPLQETVLYLSLNRKLLDLPALKSFRLFNVKSE